MNLCYWLGIIKYLENAKTILAMLGISMILSTA
jgi:hypothetical protein